MKTLFFATFIFFSVQSFAQQADVKNTSILDTIAEEGGASIVFNKDVPLEFTAKDSSGYYNLKNKIYWQSGTRFTDATNLKANEDYCQVELTSYSTINAVPPSSIKANTYISAGITGRISDQGGFATVVNLDDDNSYSDFTNPLTFTCATPSNAAHEITPNQISTITGGVIDIKFGAYILGNESTAVVAQMLIENAQGYRFFKSAHKIGPVIETTKYENISTTRTGRHTTVTVDRFTILSRDCLGTDACNGMIEWIVTATTTSDGYSWDTKYVNDVHKK